VTAESKIPNGISSKGRLEVQSLYSGYGKLVIVQDVSFTVEPSEIVALVGPNGSGKSTVLKSIFGLADVKSGSIVVDGESIVGKNTEDITTKRIAYVPQRENVFPNLTVRENLEIGAITLKDKAQTRAEIERVNSLFPQLREFSTKKARALSGGQRQMLALGRGLMLRPKILLLDEPTAALAPQVVTEVLKRISEIRDTGVTILIVEQNAREALAIADRGIVLASGSVVLENKPSSILNNEEIIRLFLGVA
jgi:branched-chain amino acid transport system ATP-binding protein